ncbi:HAD-IC family P-type ATPase, partial [uncultured Thiodictyon sp.]
MSIDLLLTGLTRAPWTWGIDALGVTLLIGYQLYQGWMFRHQPELTHRGRSNRLRRAWVETIRTGNKDILAVQTLRNWVMSATLFASTSVLIGLGFIGVAFRDLDLTDLSQTLSWAPSGTGLMRIKLLLLAAIFFSSFMHFVLALRYYNHTGFLINLPANYFRGVALDLVADTLNRAGGHYNRGTRVFLLAMPFVLWLIGPDWFLGGTLIALVLLYRFDFHDDPDLTQAAMTDATGPNSGAGVAEAHALTAAAILTTLHSRADGLTAAEAAKRLAAVGPNRLPTPPRDGPIKRYLLKFNDSLIYVLLGGAVVTALMAHWVDTCVILAVTVINATIGFIQEGKAEQALAGIRKLLAARAHCRRDGQWLELDAADLVPGDCVRLRAGDRVPADLRLRETANLSIDESALTGESVPADKDTDAVEATAGIGDRHGMAYAGTLVARGTGLGVVTGTGPTTELGHIDRLIAGVEPLATPLTRQMAAFGRILSFVILAMAVGMLLIGWQLHDFPLGDLVMAAIGFAVAAIPEGLPAVLTITLALGVQQMARRNAITRRLPAVETLGSVTVICTDKTGTLTRNEMTARQVVTRAGEYAVAGIGYAPDGEVTRDGSRVELAQAPDLADLVAVMARCNDAEIALEDGQWTLVGEPTEGALRTLARKLGFTRGDGKRLAVIPFDSEHKFMATLQEVPGAGGVERLMKGAPGALLERCTTQRAADGRDEPLDPAFWEGQIDTLSAQGLRVLAAAVGAAPDGQTELTPADLAGLTFLGVVGILDPPRPEAIAAIAAFRQAGIRVKMITGDHIGTAGAIGREMGIGERAISGAELEAASDDELRRIVGEYDVFARTSPEHKLRLVQALQANGE